MNDAKYQSACQTIKAMRKTHLTLRIDPYTKGDAYLYALLASYGYTWSQEGWVPFAGNPMIIHA